MATGVRKGLTAKLLSPIQSSDQHSLRQVASTTTCTFRLWVCSPETINLLGEFRGQDTVLDLARSFDQKLGPQASDQALVLWPMPTHTETHAETSDLTAGVQCVFQQPLNKPLSVVFNLWAPTWSVRDVTVWLHSLQSPPFSGAGPAGQDTVHTPGRLLAVYESNKKRDLPLFWPLYEPGDCDLLTGLKLGARDSVGYVHETPNSMRSRKRKRAVLAPVSATWEQLLVVHVRDTQAHFTTLRAPYARWASEHNQCPFTRRPLTPRHVQAVCQPVTRYPLFLYL